MIRRFLYVFVLFLLLLLMLFFLYLNNTRLVEPTVLQCYQIVKETLRKRGYSPNLMVISTKRHKWLNNLLVYFNGAASESLHLQGQAIDFIVYDVNRDGKSDGKDLDIVYKILDQEIIVNKGGLGIYKEKGGFFNKQMIHIDCRGFRARWE